MSLRPVALAVLLSFPLAAAPRNEAIVPRAGETIDVSIVNCDVVVTDRAGHRVHGLTLDDFEIREDGSPQAITNFAEYTAQSPQREKKNIVLFIDHFVDSRFRIEATYKALEKTMHEIVAPGDSVLIATWNGYPTIALEPTDDIAAIDATLDAIAAENTRGPFFGFDFRTMLEPGVVRRDGGIGWHIGGEEWYAQRLMADRIRNEIAAVNSLINAMAGEGGRKALILMTRSVAPVYGSDYYYTIDRDVSRWRGYYRASAFDSVKATAVAQNVAVYAFPPGTVQLSYDPFSMRNPNPSVSHELDRVSAMKDIAKATGGTYATGSDIAKALPRLRDDISDYYSFAYKEPARNDNRVRKVSVTTKNRDYVVRTRREYIEKNDDTRMRDAVIASFLRAPSSSSIDVAANLGEPVKSAKRRYTVPVSVKWPVTPLSQSVTLYIATGGADGVMSDITKRTVTLDPARVEEAKNGAVQYDFDLVADSGANRLSIGVYDDVTHDSGFARVDLPRMR
jgi:VWFA-related protein